MVEASECANGASYMKECGQRRTARLTDFSDDVSVKLCFPFHGAYAI